MLHKRLVQRLLQSLGFLSVLTFTASVHAEPNWKSLNQAVIDQHILPRYQQLQTDTQALAQATTLFCTQHTRSTFDQLKATYQHTMDSWMAIQHIRFGPVEASLRYYRYQIWPDKHNTGTKQLQRLLKSEDLKRLEPKQFAQSSVAVQGLTALERLLFPTALDLGQFGSPQAPSYHCELILAIARNLALMSSAIVTDWTVSEVPYRTRVLTAGPESDDFTSHREIASQWLNSISTQLQVITEQKLLRPLKRFRLKRAESWRSRRSLDNIFLNLHAIRELYAIGLAPKLPEDPLDNAIKKAFDQAITSITALDTPLYDIKQDSPEAKKLEKILADARQLTALASSELPQALGLSLGFNSLDGD
ncbi:MAG: imelysin family protein [Gammaproteobacteria bacterium]|nr:imelysin family protein [Gammaproteobacteria bacterium]